MDYEADRLYWCDALLDHIQVRSSEEWGEGGSILFIILVRPNNTSGKNLILGNLLLWQDVYVEV